MNEAGPRTKNAEIVCNNVIEESYDFSGGEGSAKAHLKIGTKRRKRAEVTVDEVASNKQKKVEEEIPKRNIKNTLVQHECIFCGFGFRGNPELKLHMERYQDSDHNFICPQSDCNEKFSRKDTFKVHMNKHNGKRGTKSVGVIQGMCPYWGSYHRHLFWKGSLSATLGLCRAQ